VILILLEGKWQGQVIEVMGWTDHRAPLAVILIGFEVFPF
jgi:hypothetical protein